MWETVGWTLGWDLGAACLSGLGHLGYVVCFPGLKCLKVALEWGQLGAVGFCVIVSPLAYGVPTANGSQQLIVIGTLSGESEGGVCGCGVVAALVSGLVNYVCATAY